MPKETPGQRAGHAWAETLLLFSHVPLFNRLALAWYKATSKPKASDPALGNTGTLAPTLMRGAQPSAEGLAQLKELGVSTVINLRVENNDEAAAVKAAGLKAIYLPLPALAAPSFEDGLKFLSAVTDPANGKVYFHCQHGRDRTGAMAAAYRIAVQGWSLQRAEAEMLQFHFKLGEQDEKLRFVQDFAKRWSALSPAEKARTLHQG